MSKSNRINRMMAWLENRIDKALDRLCEADEVEVTRQMSVLAHLYQLQQTSVRMDRQRKMMEEVREDGAADLPKSVRN